MRIGALDKRITLQSKTQVRDAMGGFTETWATVATVWAKITTLRTTEAIINMAGTGSAIHNVVIRYRSDITGAWRLLYRGKYWAIIGPPIDVNKDREWLDIKAKEKV